MISKAILVGQVSQYINHSYTAAGKPILKFQVGCKISREKGAPLAWWEVVQFGPMADTLQKMIFKGQKVYVDGLLTMRKYQDKAGVERTLVSVLADNVQFLSFQEKGDSAAGPEPIQPGIVVPVFNEDDCPF